MGQVAKAPLPIQITAASKRIRARQSYLSQQLTSGEISTLYNVQRMVSDPDKAGVPGGHTQGVSFIALFTVIVLQGNNHRYDDKKSLF